MKNSDLGLHFINSLRAVSWVWKNSEQGTTEHYGVIAQEAEAAIAKAKGQSKTNVIVNHDKVSDSYSVRYTELISPLIKAVQELYHKLMGVDREIASVKNENAELKARVEKTEKENEELKKRLDRIEKALSEKK